MKEINKNKILIITVTIILAIVSYSNFLPEYYSIDTTKIIKDGYLAYGMQYSLQDARIFAFLIFLIAEIINISLRNLWQILLISAIIISSISVLKIYNIILKIKPATNKETNILVYMMSYCYIFNFMYVDALEFAENWIIALSILFYIKSAEELMINNKKIKGLIFFVIGILFYQGTINLFIATALLFLIINQKENIKEKAKRLLIAGIIASIVVGIDFLIINIIKANMTVIQTARLSWDLARNIKMLKVNIPNLIVKSVKLFPEYLQIILIIILIITIFINKIKEKKPLKILIPICLIVVCYLSTLGLCILTPNMLTASNGRMFISIGIIISTLLIYAYTNTNIFETKKFAEVIKTFIIIYFIINIANNINTTTMLKEGNNIDREISYEIQEEIKKYENETKTKIKYLAVRYRVDMETEKKWIRSKKMLRAYNALVYETYTGEKIQDTTFTPQIQSKYFKKVKKTIKCVDDTIYILM